jgi:pyruvate-formate lyase-activating enzyme
MLEQIRSALTPIGTLAGPIQLILFITDRCNARCHHCFNWQAVNYGDDGLRLDELRALSSDLGSLLTLSISGGEPSLRADLAEAITIFTGGNSVGDISIPTNGLLPDALCTQVRHLLDQQGAGTYRSPWTDLSSFKMKYAGFPAVFAESWRPVRHWSAFAKKHTPPGF